MDIKNYREQMLKSAEKALKELDKLITQEILIEELDPEKAKQAAQGKIEAIKGYDEILTIIETRIENESNSEEGESESSIFDGGGRNQFGGIEKLAKK